MAPGAVEATHDPGFDQEGSKIRALGGDVYRYAVDTRMMRGGHGWWYALGEYNDVEETRAKLGKFVVREAPQALIDRNQHLASTSRRIVGDGDLWKFLIGVIVGVTAAMLFRSRT